MNRSRVAFVSGGSGGIGAAIARELADAGMDVVVADLDGNAARRVSQQLGGNSSATELDVTDLASVTSAIDGALGRHGVVDVCVNSAGWEASRAFVDADDEFIQRILDVNLVGAMRITRAVLPAMVDHGWGRIVNVASEAGRIGAPRSAAYAASKGGLIAFTKSVAAEVAAAGVTANAVAPGAIDTPLLYSSHGEHVDKVMRYLLRAIPAKRIGQPNEVAAAVGFLATDGAAYITGQTLSISGGLTML